MENKKQYSDSAPLINNFDFIIDEKTTFEDLLQKFDVLIKPTESFWEICKSLQIIGISLRESSEEFSEFLVLTKKDQQFLIHINAYDPSNCHVSGLNEV